MHALFEPEHEIVALRDKFAPDISDTDLIDALRSDGPWVIVSGDRRITKNRAHAAAFRNSRLIGFFLSKGLYKTKVQKQAERLLALWENMEAVAARVEGGAMFELPVRSTRLRQIR
jgi:hypothetical protein